MKHPVRVPFSPDPGLTMLRDIIESAELQEEIAMPLSCGRQFIAI
jgi:hypothetical protein